MKTVSTPIAIIAAVLILAIAAMLFLLSQTGSQPIITTPTTSTSQSVNFPALKLVFDQHITKISSRDISAVLTDYQQNAVVLWTGQTQGLGGIYTGTEKITVLYANALSMAKLTITPSGYSQLNGTANQATVQSMLNINGTSNYLGAFNGTVLAQVTYKSDNGAWKISNENWDYKALNITVAGGATTFPEWQKVGPVIPSRLSPDWLHNFAWDYGGLGVAVLVWAYIAVIAALILAKSITKPFEKT